MRYIIKKTDVINPGISSTEWEKAEPGVMGFDHKWKEFVKAPLTTFKVLKGPEGMSVLMNTKEYNLRSEIKEQNGLVCTDSCMEFFFKPDPWDVNYFNFELNPGGYLYLAIGPMRSPRKLINVDREIFSIESDAKEGDWTLKFYIPDSFVLRYFDKIHPVMRGNFYKCGDDTDHRHYATWAEVETERPDYHLPDFFDKLEIER